MVKTKFCIILLIIITLIIGVLYYFTNSNLKPIPQSFHKILSNSQHLQILDRNAQALNFTYQNNWNIHNFVPLHEIPEFLKVSFITSEDKRFYEHLGADWFARFSALVSNVKNMRKVRGASTITEQVVRMINPRPRKIWSRWLEGFEAKSLSRSYSKDEVLEFYLNQIPYAANRRGVAQAARYYFNRDLETLSKKEMLALVVLVRAPSRLDLWKNTQKIEASIKRLTKQLIAGGVLSQDQSQILLAQKFDLEAPKLAVNASEFVRYVKNHPQVSKAGWPYVRTTLDSSLQQNIQTMLDERLASLKSKKVSNGAVLVVNHTNGEILAWVVAGKENENTPNRFIDAVTIPRQPGSALKPFLYSLALEKGWTAATIIDDSALKESVGNGIHSYQNYSRRFYGPVTLRQALGNSLNIPALKALQYVGSEDYLNYLHNIGFTELNNHPNFYGDGIALGNGEVTLFQLVQAYAAMANNGLFRPLEIFAQSVNDGEEAAQVLSPEIASLMGNILSDNSAREFEFGENSVLNFTVQTAVKTGTSSDYRDAWAVGYNYAFTAGIWLGNLDGKETDGVTGSTGPALLLRSIFNELNKNQKTKPLPIHKKLVKHDLCLDSHQIKLLDENCQTYTEWFTPNSLTKKVANSHKTKPKINLRRPTNGLHIAYDPRLPKESQFFQFHIENVSNNDTVKWLVNDKEYISKGGKYSWALEKGTQIVRAVIYSNEKQIYQTKQVTFLVK